MAEIYLDKEEKDALAKSGLDSANSLYGLANAWALTAESCKWLTPQEINELETNLVADKLGIKAEKKPLLQKLFTECKSGSLPPVAAVNSPGNWTPAWKWRPSPSVTSFDSSSFEDIPNKSNPNDTDIYSAAMIVERNMGRWLYQSKEQWDDRLLQFGVTQTEYEHIFTAMTDYIVPNTSGTASFHGRSSNMETVTKLLVEYEADPKKAAEVYTKLQRMAKSMKDEADTTLLVSLGWVLTVVPVSTPLTLLWAWAVSHYWLKDAGIPYASKMAEWYDNLAMSILKKMPWFTPTKFDFDALPKDVRDIVEKQMRTTINKIQVAGWKAVFTDAEFATGWSDAEKAFNDMKTKMSKKMPFSAEGMMDEYKWLTDNKDGKIKDAALKKTGKAVGGTASGRFWGKAIQDGRAFMEWVKKWVPLPVKLNIAWLEEALLTSEENSVLSEIQNRAREIDSVKKQIDDLQAKRDEKLQTEMARLDGERTRLTQQLTELEWRRQTTLQQQSTALQWQIDRTQWEMTTISGNRTSVLNNELSRLSWELTPLTTELTRWAGQRDQVLEQMKKEKVRELNSLIQTEITNEQGKSAPDTTKIRELTAATKSADPHLHAEVQKLASDPSFSTVIDTITHIEWSRASWASTHGTIASDTRISRLDASMRILDTPNTGAIAVKTREIADIRASIASPSTPHPLVASIDAQIREKTEKLNGKAWWAIWLIADKNAIDTALSGWVHTPHASVNGIDAQIRWIRSGNPTAPGLLDTVETNIRDMNHAKVNKAPHAFVNADDAKLAVFRTQLTDLFTDPARGIDALLGRLKNVALGNDIKLLIPTNYVKGTTHTVNGEVATKIGELYESLIKWITKARKSR